MRAHLRLFALLASGLLGGNPARAGVYFASDPPLSPDSAPWVKFVLGELRAVPVQPPDGSQPDPGSLRYRYLERLSVLEASERDGSLSNLDRIDLGACYIRFRRFGDAIGVLEAGDKTHFLILANLATAFYEMGEMDRALAYQGQALANWPPVWAGWTTRQWSWFHRSERVFQQLIESRQKEKELAQRTDRRATGGPVGAAQTIDPLFPRFHLPVVARYQAGPLPLLDEDLPPNARETVAQLMIWLPFDGRLTWLYAELLNVSGDVDGAYRLMDELVFTRDWSNVENLKRHKQILQAARESRQAVTPDCWAKLFWSLAPRGIGAGVPVLGQAAAEYGWAASDQLAQMPPGDGLGPQNAANSIPSGSGNPILSERASWYLGIGFGTGVLVTLLGVLQGRQWLRRRRDQAVAA
jgi:hypothetical protein